MPYIGRVSLTSINQLFLEIDSLIWKHTKILQKSIGDRWNLIFCLHHELILAYSSLVISSIAEEGSTVTGCQYNKRSKNQAVYHFLFIGIAGFHSINSLFKIGLRLIKVLSHSLLGSSSTDRVYLSLDPELELQYLSDLTTEINRYLLNNSIIVNVSVKDLLSSACISIRRISWIDSICLPRLLLVGSRVPTNYRICVCNVLKTHGVVLATTHGQQSNTIFNEPIFGYSEMVAATFLFDAGSACKRINYSDAHDPLICINTSSSRIRKLAQISSVDDGSNGAVSNKIVYLPTALLGKSYYLPYHYYPDDHYIRYWEQILLSDPDTCICLHPKTDASIDGALFGKFKEKYRDRLLEMPLDSMLASSQLKNFVIDHISTVSAQLIAAHKNVLFIDLGRRNLQNSYARLLQSYFFVVTESDLANPLCLPTALSRLRERDVYASSVLDARDKLMSYSL